jgi:hypothetical protein
MKYYRIIVTDNENSPTSYVYIATIDENNGLSRINGLEVTETVVHSKINEITNAFLNTFFKDAGLEDISIILEDIRQKLNGYDVQIGELTKLEDKIDERIRELTNGAPEVLDTLKELSDALNNDPDFATNIVQQLADKVDKEINKGLSSNDFTTDEKNKLAGIAINANRYTHPSYTPIASGLYKITVDATGHISLVETVVKTDITSLGIPAQDTVYTHPNYSSRVSGLYKITVDKTGHITAVTAIVKADITELGIPSQDTTYGVVSKTANGLAPKLPNETTITKYLRQDGTWAIPVDLDDYYTKEETDTKIENKTDKISLFYDNKPVDKVYFEDQKVARAYYGDILVYPIPISLRVVENELYYGDETILLHGVNVGDFNHYRLRGVDESIYTPPWDYISTELNANIVRIMCHPSFFIDGLNSGNDISYSHLYKKVDEALEAGLFVIIDYHAYEYPVTGAGVDHYVNDDGILIGYNTSIDKAIAFWNTIANHYKNESRVIFELWNEPYGTSWSNLKPFWENLITYIRDTGASNLVLATGPNWAHDLFDIPSSLLSDNNTCYTMHTYANETSANTAGWINNLGGEGNLLTDIKPVMITEYGWDMENTQDPTYLATNQEADAFAEEFYTFVNAYKMHSVAFSYDIWYDPNLMNDDADGFTDLNYYGNQVKSYLINREYIKPDTPSQPSYDFTGKTLYSAGESTTTGFGLSGSSQSENDFNNSWPFLVADVLGMNKTHIGWPGATVFNWLDVNSITNVDPTTIDDNEVYGSFYAQIYRILKPLDALTTVHPEVDGIMLLMIGGNDSLIQGIYGNDVTSISPYTTAYCIANASSFNVSGQYVPNYGASSQACYFWCLKKLRTQLPNLKIIIVQTNRLQITSVSVNIVNRIDEMNSAFANYFNTNYGNVYYIPYSEGGTSLGPSLTNNYVTGNYEGHPNQAWNNAMRDWLVPKIQALAVDW